MATEETSEKILHDAKKRLNGTNWQKRYGSYLEALLSETAADTLKVVEQQNSRATSSPL